MFWGQHTVSVSWLDCFMFVLPLEGSGEVVPLAVPHVHPDIVPHPAPQSPSHRSRHPDVCCRDSLSLRAGSANGRKPSFLFRSVTWWKQEERVNWRVYFDTMGRKEQPTEDSGMVCSPVHRLPPRKQFGEGGCVFIASVAWNLSPSCKYTSFLLEK